MTYTAIVTEPEAQFPTETVWLSDDSSLEDQDSRRSDHSGSDTEPDAKDNDNPDCTRAGQRHRSRTADKETNNRVSSVRVSSTCG